MKNQLLFCGTVALLVAAQPAFAQTYQDLRGDGASDVRVTAGITIPFGGRSRDAESKPRLQLGVDRRQQQRDVLLTTNAIRAYETAQWRRTSLSLTFEDNPRMLMNGTQVARFNLATYADEEDDEGGGGGSTALIVGGVVVLGALVAVTLDGVDAIGDDFRPD